MRTADVRNARAAGLNDGCFTEQQLQQQQQQQQQQYIRAGSPAQRQQAVRPDPPNRQLRSADALGGSFVKALSSSFVEWSIGILS
jgi:hypothetical protein